VIGWLRIWDIAQERLVIPWRILLVYPYSTFSALSSKAEHTNQMCFCPTYPPPLIVCCQSSFVLYLLQIKGFRNDRAAILHSEFLTRTSQVKLSPVFFVQKARTRSGDGLGRYL
jgi:hypothetical protein